MMMIKKRILTCYRTVTVPFLFMGLVVPSFGGEHPPFRKDPDARREFVERIAKDAAEKREEAHTWAEAQGQPTRFEKNGTLFELKAMHEGSPLYYKSLNRNAAITTTTDKVRATDPYEVEGAGVTVGVWDGGEAMVTHQEFGNRVTNKDDCAVYSHATHVGGTIAAAGVDVNAKGMAPAAFIDSYDWTDDLSEMAAVAASGPNQAGVLYLSNHSYGFDISDSAYFGQYNAYVAEIDELVYGAGYYLPFVASGNEQEERDDGYDTLSFYAVAKNVITVGAVKNSVSNSARSLSGATLAYFSSFGPTDDGRIKPDIVANGWSIYSASSSSDSAYESMSGTSMASPNACGSAALLIDYYDDRFPGEAMWASTLKGLIIHTADDLGNSGPDYQYGWGLMNTRAAVELLDAYADGSELRLTEGGLYSLTNTSDTFTIYCNGYDDLRVTLCWTDPEGRATRGGTDSRTLRLVNDLDLTVEAEDGSLYYPFSLDVENPTEPATALAKNDTDNVEQVLVAAPASGTYTVTVNYDGGLRNSEQSYALLISGGVSYESDSDNDTLPDYWESLYFTNTASAIVAEDSDKDGMSNYDEYIAGTDPTDDNSFLEVLSEAYDSGLVISWSSVTGKVYSLCYCTNLVTDDFCVTQSAIEATPPMNTFTAEVTNADCVFYRISVDE